MDSDDDFMMDDAVLSDEESMFDDENQAVNRVQAVKEAAVGKPAVLSASTNNKKTKTVEQMYQKKSQLEHILLRPDTYSKCASRAGNNVTDNDARPCRIYPYSIASPSHRTFFSPINSWVDGKEWRHYVCCVPNHKFQ